MGYFTDHYTRLSFPVKVEDTPGFHRAQLGAIFGIASHFSLRTEPAIVVMPTGSGKTAVLMASAFLLRAKRILVLTPSQLVRAQIAEEFKEFALLRSLGAIPDGIGNPNVIEITKRMDSSEQWEAIEAFDVAVATPNSVSPAIAQVSAPPDDLFDLILVDEAHHSPASTWRNTLSAFPNAKTVLVTATPFRRDRKEISGRFAYVYPLREARKDGVFGDILFVPVEPEGKGSDAAIAIEAERILNEDRNKGLNHRLMVRTDGLKRAEELEQIYRDETDLRLETIHSRRSLRFAKQVIQQLRDGELDGIICVNMLGEGFDFPNLKIAAIHSPHRSLAVTLQFIGRFARTNANDIGQAKFIAVPDDIQIESQKLYDESAVWEELVTHLSHSRVNEEVQIRETLEGFERDGGEIPQEEDISLFSLRPFAHVKIYRANGEVDLVTAPNLPENFELEGFWCNPDLPAQAAIFAQLTKPKWSTTDIFTTRVYHLLVAYYDSDSRHLFINCSATKSLELYDRLVEGYASGACRMLTVGEVDRVLAGLPGLEFFQVGLRNRAQAHSTESYLIRTGPAAQDAVSETDARIYHRGHLFGRSETETIGYSSSSKVWSTKRLLIPQLVAWAQEVGRRLVSTDPVVTGSNLDRIECGRHIDNFPPNPIAAVWDRDTWKSPPTLTHAKLPIRSLLEADIIIRRDAATENELLFDISFADASISFKYLLENGFSIEPVDSSAHDLWKVEHRDDESSLAHYLRQNPPVILFADYSALYGHELVSRPEGPLTLNDERFQIVDWKALGVNIEDEFTGRDSIRAYLEGALPSEHDLLIYDHRSGEIADFIGLNRGPEWGITFYHCKGSTESFASERVSDVYEVAEQVIKSMIWVGRVEATGKKILNRLQSGSKILLGDLDAVKKFFEDARFESVRFHVAAVQPGISRKRVSKLADNLAAMCDHCMRSGASTVRIVCSD